MRPHLLVPLLVPLLVAALSLAASACLGPRGVVRWEDVEPAGEGPAREHPAREHPAREHPAPINAAPTNAAPTNAARPPEAPAAARPADPISPEPINAPAALIVNGAQVEDGAVVEIPSLELACIADATALAQPKRVLVRLDTAGRKLGAMLGPFSFIVLERDPARSLSDPPPRVCRVLQERATLLAPVTHNREPASRWLVRRARAGVVADTAALLAHCDSLGLDPVGRPRVLVDEHGALIALAVPVTKGGS